MTPANAETSFHSQFYIFTMFLFHREIVNTGIVARTGPGQDRKMGQDCDLFLLCFLKPDPGGKKDPGWTLGLVRISL